MCVCVCKNWILYYIGVGMTELQNQISHIAAG